MADVLQFEKGRAKALGEKLSPVLREFIDIVIVPALVREDLSETKCNRDTNSLAPLNCDMADSAAGGSFLDEVPR